MYFQSLVLKLLHQLLDALIQIQLRHKYETLSSQICPYPNDLMSIGIKSTYQRLVCNILHMG